MSLGQTKAPVGSVTVGRFRFFGDQHLDGKKHHGVVTTCKKIHSGKLTYIAGWKMGAPD